MHAHHRDRLPPCSKALAAIKSEQSESWLPPILEFIPQAYAQTHFPVFLYLSSHILRHCGTPDAPHHQQVAQATIPMVLHACERLASLHDCNERPNDCDDLFLTAFKGLLHTPHVFLHQQVLPALVGAALPAVLVQQPDAFKSVQSFLWRLFDPTTLERAPQRDETQQLLQVCRQGAPTLLLCLWAKRCACSLRTCFDASMGFHNAACGDVRGQQRCVRAVCTNVLCVPMCT